MSAALEIMSYIYKRWEIIKEKKLPLQENVKVSLILLN
jgi:hypothetical protein